MKEIDKKTARQISQTTSIDKDQIEDFMIVTGLSAFETICVIFELKAMGFTSLDPFLNLYRRGAVDINLLLK